MYGDPARLRADAASLRSDATQMRAQASTLRAQASGLGWHSIAGDAFRAQLDAIAADLGRSAAFVEEAADQLSNHARAVGDLHQQITNAERTFAHLIDEAHTLVRSAADAATGLAERAREIVQHLPVRPPPGSEDWLKVKTLFASKSW